MIETSLFQTVLTLQSLPGWCDHEKACTLASIVLVMRHEVSVEIGIFGGRSLIPIALAHQNIGKGKVIGIDPWDKDVAVREQTQEADKKWWSELDYEKVRGEFMAAIRQHNLGKWTTIIRNESKNVTPPDNIGLLHVDGSHSHTAMQDMIRFGPKVAQGGFCVTDDTTWHGGGVSDGEKELVKMGFKRLYALGTGAVFQRL